MHDPLWYENPVSRPPPRRLQAMPYFPHHPAEQLLVGVRCVGVSTGGRVRRSSRSLSPVAPSLGKRDPS